MMNSIKGEVLALARRRGWDSPLHAALFDHGIDTSILEAMQAGVPIVATKVGGIPEIINDEVDGILINQGDTAELANAIKKLLSDTSLMKKMGENAYMKITKQYSINQYSENLINLYRKALDTRK